MLSAYTADFAQRLYTEETERVTRFQRPMRAQTHQIALRMAKQFFRWVVGRGHLRSSPFEKVKRTGKAQAGKQQLRIDEARQLTQVLLSAGREGEEGP